MLRCKNCKAKVENENLYRCPQCGKVLIKKNRKPAKDRIPSLAFAVCSLIFLVTDFICLFFKCDYYNGVCVITGVIVFLVVFPFVFADRSGIGRSVPRILAVTSSVPFLADKAVCFSKYGDTIVTDTLSTVYYLSIPVLIILCDVLIILDISRILKSSVSCVICLAAASAGLLFTIIFYSICGAVKPLAISVIAVNAFIPCYTAFHVIKNTGKNTGLKKVN